MIMRSQVGERPGSSTSKKEQTHQAAHSKNTYLFINQSFEFWVFIISFYYE